MFPWEDKMQVHLLFISVFVSSGSRKRFEWSKRAQKQLENFHIYYYESEILDYSFTFFNTEIVLSRALDI